MKKTILFALALTLSAAWPTAASAATDNCGCAAADVTCINECTMSKVTTLRKNLETQKANAKAKLEAAKASNNSADSKAKAQAKAKKAAKDAKKALKDEANSWKQLAK